MTKGEVRDRVYIFDTTLRDGEQSPGFGMGAEAKLELAQQLARLGVDVIEAGFPISSPGDFESCRRIARCRDRGGVRTPVENTRCCRRLARAPV